METCVPSDKHLTRETLNDYFDRTAQKIRDYLEQLEDAALLSCPPGCEYTRFTLILAQHRHLHSHMGMIMGFIIDDTGLWPRVVGLEKPIPDGDYEKYL